MTKPKQIKFDKESRKFIVVETKEKLSLDSIQVIGTEMLSVG